MSGPTNIADAMDEVLRRMPPPQPEDAVAEAEAERERQYRKHRERERERKWKSIAGELGPRYADCALGNFETTCDLQRKAVEQLDEYTDQMKLNVELGRPILFFGPAGTGKDHLMAAMMRYAIDCDLTVAWTDGMSLFGEMRDSMETRTSERQILGQYTHTDVLGISDPVPPTGALTEFQMATLFRIVDRRYRDRKPTWITVNAAKGEELEKRIGVQVVDRLRHDALMVPCKWESYRRGPRPAVGGLQ